MTFHTLRSLMTAVICEPSAELFIISSHCVVMTRAGASARVKSATNTISGSRSKRIISVLDTTAEATADSRREYERHASVQAIRQILPDLSNSSPSLHVVISYSILF